MKAIGAAASRARSYPLGASPPQPESIGNCRPVRARAHDSGSGAGSDARAGQVAELISPVRALFNVAIELLHIGVVVVRVERRPRMIVALCVEQDDIVNAAMLPPSLLSIAVGA